MDYAIEAAVIEVGGKLRPGAIPFTGHLEFKADGILRPAAEAKGEGVTHDPVPLGW